MDFEMPPEMKGFRKPLKKENIEFAKNCKIILQSFVKHKAKLDSF